ncbi:cytochrome P450 [Micromonospora coxensis]|uniref:Cytochrome P450 n=1 Tax=Micromonospora coxensis TaxID=356852 RepID=A0A1C5K2P6_9ACTN|nr:cytochrome P450 [Micromonospora coxensis]SCG77008.1 Cytochrome P450 [Micromonospora coxensis]
MAPLIGDFDPFSPEMMADPYPVYATLLRADGPVYLDRRGIWIVSGYDDVRAAAKDHERFSSADGIAYDKSSLPILFGVDPPDHTRLRRLINRDLTPRAVESWRPFVEQICRELLDAALAAEDVEMVNEVLVPLPVRVIAAVLGIPGDDVAQFKAWSAGVIEGFNANARLRPRSGLDDGDPDSADRRRAAKKALSAVAGISVYFQTLLDQRRRQPTGDDLISKLLAANEDQLRDEELVWLCLALLVGGNETTTHLLGNLCLALIDHPDQDTLVRARQELIPGTVEETLRFDPPVQSVFRTATTDVEIGGTVIPEGSRVQLSFAAANRDPRRWEDPERFRVERQSDGHVAFGSGIHFCVGAPLVRLETSTFLRQLLARTERIALSGPFRRIKSPTFRGFEELPLHLTPRVMA